MYECIHRGSHFSVEELKVTLIEVSNRDKQLCNLATVMFVLTLTQCNAQSDETKRDPLTCAINSFFGPAMKRPDISLA